jgi:phosphotransferase system  glucose/maltose/N-acetylglucosamine-specific IIC component
MLILYDLPDWLMAVVIVGTIVGLSYAGYFLVHRIGHRSFSEAETNVAMTVLTVIATVTSLLLAFCRVIGLGVVRRSGTGCRRGGQLRRCACT